MKRSLKLAVFLAAVVSAASAAPRVSTASGDYLARLIEQGDLGWSVLVIGLGVAFVMGAVHALSPGHGKTLVAAYLVGTRGTPKHAVFLGGMVTFTHTISVFLLGLVTLFLSQYVLPDKISTFLGAVSGIAIIWIGATLFFKRLRIARAHDSNDAQDQHHQHHHDEHDEGHHHDPANGHTHAHEHTHEDYGGVLVHRHGDEHAHRHVPEGEISLGSLIALGASGGLVPCPSALVLLLSSIALGRVGLGLTLLVAFSLGLAGVLMAIGLVVVYAKHLLPDSRKTSQHAAFRLIPVASAAIIVCVGLIMTCVSLGVIRPGQFLSGV